MPKTNKTNQQTPQAQVKKTLASSVLAAALASANAAGAAEFERCADVVAGGKNSCAVKALGLTCHGSATEDNTPGAWIEVPTGTCANIVSICTEKMEAPADADQALLTKACGKLAQQSDESITGGRLVDRMGEPI